MAINRKEQFGVEGFRLQRNNPDGTIPTYDRMLGTSGGVDVSSLSGTEVIWVKEDNGTATSETVDITGGVYADNTSATVGELVTALTAAIATTNLTFTSDAGTSRLHAALTSGTATKIQIYGDLISFLGFGKESAEANDSLTTGIGLKIVSAFDSTKSIGLPKNIKDKEEIENETGDGSLTSVITNAIVKGLTPVMTCAKNDYEMKWLVMGGVYTAASDTYEPPTIESQTTKPSFNVEIFSPGYDQGSNLKTNIAGWEYILLRNCTGYEGDISKEVKAFTDIVFNLDAAEYVDSSGTKFAAYTEEQLTLAEYEALDVTNV
jgi:hypothetical protein